MFCVHLVYHEINSLLNLHDFEMAVTGNYEMECV